MYERFTDRSRSVISFAQAEAERRGHAEVQADDLLLGLLKERNGVAANVLLNLGVNEHSLRENLDRDVNVAEREKSGWRQALVRFFPSAEAKRAAFGLKRTVEFAMYEARRLEHNFVGTEHLLLGLMRLGDDRIDGSLRALAGVSPEDVRREVLNLLGHDL